MAALDNETNLFTFSGIEPRFLSRQARSVVAIPNEPSWLMRYIRPKYEPLAHRGFDVFFFIVAPCIMESIYCSFTNNCTFY